MPCRADGAAAPQEIVTMRCSVIIPTYNRADSLRACLTAVGRQEEVDYEVIVVDDASTDATPSLMRREFPHVRSLRQDTNIGSSAARNRGIAAASGDVLVFTDDDCVAPPHWLRGHLRHHLDRRVGVVGGPLITRFPGFCDRFLAAHYRQEREQFRRIPSSPDLCRLVSGNMSVRRDVVERLGRFDERYWTGADAELARRASRAGYEVISDPTLAVDHLKTYTVRSFLIERFRKSFGSLLTDLDDGTLQLRRFIPLPNLTGTRTDWRNYKALYGASGHFAAFCALAMLTRWADVSGRAYWYWKMRSAGRASRGR